MSPHRMSKDGHCRVNSPHATANTPTIYNCQNVENFPGVTQHAAALFLKPFNCETVPDPDEFWVCFWELIRGHYILQKKLGIVHGDISIHNMTIQHAPVRKAMLIDFDIAEVAREHTPFSGWQRSRQIGSKPFLSQRLLGVFNVDNPLARTYADDLESFFYCLLWLILEAGFPADSRAGSPDTIASKRNHLKNAVVGHQDAVYPCPALWPGFDQFRSVIKNWYRSYYAIQYWVKVLKETIDSPKRIETLLDFVKDTKPYPLGDSQSWIK
ncbi:hypothetical protein CYLTODRAFT_491015 [Cylindrobasidium torrendii FP15055 ss-10]|uniref:Fungal-type protein kinase domain-containing protein n=1 Tax=Cylindrobasidium torrendii FP15055 ss-10 TaxID=1314674 RepID=A0A0D7B927_9AGAR|nr:hypothetical protein CYLTODRAFT_491015 [Cylindrobasidium torrendii FP15055 ss-10]